MMPFKLSRPWPTRKSMSSTTTIAVLVDDQLAAEASAIVIQTTGASSVAPTGPQTAPRSEP